MNTNRLKDFKNYQKNENKRKVLNAITVLKKIKPSQIFEFIDKQSEENTKKYFCEILNKSYTSEEFVKKKKELSISLKTVKNIVNELYQENKINHEKGGYYSLNEFISSNKFLIFPDEFGESIIYSIGNFVPTTIEKSLEEYVNRYGLFIILVFLRVMYFRNSNQNENKEIFLTDNEMDSWIKDAIPLKLMFDLFSGLYYNDNENKKTINLQKLERLNKIIELKYPSLYREFDKVLTENRKKTQNNKQGKKVTELALNKFEEEKRREKSFKNYKLGKFELPSIIDNRAHARVLSKEWREQLSQLAKESD
jgi:hypothetical protein